MQFEHKFVQCYVRDVLYHIINCHNLQNLERRKKKKEKKKRKRKKKEREKKNKEKKKNCNCTLSLKHSKPLQYTIEEFLK